MKVDKDNNIVYTKVYISKTVQNIKYSYTMTDTLSYDTELINRRVSDGIVIFDTPDVYKGYGGVRKYR